MVKDENFERQESVVGYPVNCRQVIPYDYTVEVRNGFQGLDLIDRVSNELWTEVHDIVQETGIKTIPKKKNIARTPKNTASLITVNKNKICDSDHEILITKFKLKLKKVGT